MARDKNGRFIKGQSGNPAGRSRREVEQAFHQSMVGRVSLEEWQKIVDFAVKEALAGDKDARVWLGNYLMGKPQGRLDVTSGDEALQGLIINLGDADETADSDS